MSTNTIAKHSLKTTTLYHVITNNLNTIMFVFYCSVCILYNYWAINYISNYFDSTTFDSYKLSLNTSSQLRYNKTEIQNEFLTTKYLKIVHPNEFNDLKIRYAERIVIPRGPEFQTFANDVLSGFIDQVLHRLKTLLLVLVQKFRRKNCECRI